MSKFALVPNYLRAFAALLVLVFSALVASPALADGETPPPDEGTSEVTDTTSTEAVSTEMPPVEESTPVVEQEASITPDPTATVAPTEVSPQLEEPAPEVVPVETQVFDQLPEGMDDQSINPLVDLPEGTELVVLDSDGEQVPLVSEEAAEILASGDPIWCPSGVVPKPGVGGCSASATSIAQLVTYYPNGFPTNGTIWVEWSSSPTAYGGVISGSGSWAAKSIYSLTIQGGWNGTPGSTALNAAYPYSTFGDILWIEDWVGAVTLKNLIFDGVVFSSAFDYSPVQIETKGNIVLDKVTSINSNNVSTGFGSGALLDNTSGTGSVTVQNSSFSNNEGAGLWVLSKGSVTLKNVIAAENGFDGARIWNYTATSAKPISVSNSSFENNASDPLAYAGLYAWAKGTITLTNISASNNGQVGVMLQNTDATTAAPIYVNGFNSFNNNGVVGLSVSSNGLIQVNNTTALDNADQGVYLSNQFSPYSSGVTILGFLNVGNNGNSGIEIRTKGTITATNLTSHDNSGYGVYINNADYDTGTHTLLITGTNTIHDNNSDGLFIKVTGAVTLYNVTALKNLMGANIANNFGGPGGVTLYGYGILQNNSDDGLHIESDGAVTLNYLTSVENNGDGVYLDNRVTAKALPVYINGINLLQGNTGNGLMLLSYGTVALNNISALDNDKAGVATYNTNPWGTPYAVYLTGTNRFEDNGYQGIAITSLGAIILSNVTAIGNSDVFTDPGVDLFNRFNTTSQQSVYLYGTNFFNSNAGIGLFISSYGSVSLNNVTSMNNGDTPLDGDGTGVLILNKGGSYPRGVSLTGLNVFNSNDGYGLSVTTDGAISISKPTAFYNGFNGLQLDNQNAFQSNVTISGFGQFSYNGNLDLGDPYEDGLLIRTHGTVTLANITATFNHGSGATIDTVGLTSVHAVTLTGTNNFNYNGDAGNESGLSVNADGTISVYNITANYNYFRGAHLDNYTNWALNGFAYPGSVNILGYGTFIGNVNYTGLEVDTHTSTTLNRITSNYNGAAGIDVDADGNITLVCVVAYNNSSYDLFVDGGVNLTLKGLLSYFEYFVHTNTGTTTRTTCP